ncbi:hypothetical protein [Mycobacteroides abscessus]|uniref:hypothetical protein n=1 Tax=Mycobacteroides abscessus TaxID=36809 RepID=UPI0011B24F6B|nr:hypothetical protein [Mycobacteroides abscessus]
MTNAGADNPTDVLIGMARQLLDDPMPKKVAQDWAALGADDGKSPIDRAISGFMKAARRVDDSDYEVARMDWEERQRRIRGWIDYLEAHRAPDAESLAQKILAGGEIDFSADIIGSPKWDEMMTEFQELMAWCARRSTESARKHRELADGFERIATIIERSKERMTEIAHRATPEIEKLADGGDTEGRDRLIKAARREVNTVSKTAVGQVNTQTRRVLDLDENTAAYTVTEWLEMHEIDTSHPEP